MDFKININKLHFDTSNMFDKVLISEKSNNKYGNYIEMSIFEGTKEAKIIIKKSDLNENVFKWEYFSNPLVNESYMVERVSSLESFVNDINDIFDKNRFDTDYINNLK